MLQIVESHKISPLVKDTGGSEKWSYFYPINKLLKSHFPPATHPKKRKQFNHTPLSLHEILRK